MSENIIPLRRRGEEQSPLSRVDHDAVELLATGQAPSLLGARAEVITKDLYARREQMTALLADLGGREPTGHAQIDDTNANLVAMINYGIAQIDAFIARAQVLTTEAAAQSQPDLAD
ncbi:hypothetical protein [Methylobacterium radiotolerans]|uniref:hypothetical protein n=1 Tax=Methylobacterium radiotolerans TaxID=31998 RepID=UPI001F39D793|nr:hypothetical protein [Methylobacterium radiotolerans]UIY45786.1 hypothetical protein LZ599_32030 [Methylobacterium radiotolerans]